MPVTRTTKPLLDEYNRDDRRKMRRNLLLEDAWKAISGCKVGSSEIGALQISLVTVSLGCDLHDDVGPQDVTLNRML